MDSQQISAAFRRCLLELDVAKLMALHKIIAPYDPDMTPVEATVSMHIARVETRNFRRAVKDYSRDWLRDHGYVFVDGKWQRSDALERIVFAEAVGISSMRSPGYKAAFNLKIERGMSDVLLNAMAKGIHEPGWQSEIMQKERHRIRFKARV